MADDFDPDAYLRGLQQPAASSGEFDPDAYVKNLPQRPQAPVSEQYGTPLGESGQSPPAEPKPWSQVGKEAVSNALPSVGGVLYDTAHGLYQMGRHPIDTYENFRDLGHGVLQKTGIMSGDEYVKNADAFSQHFADKYGSMENFKNTLATDPASVLADASLALTGGGALLRGAGKIAEVSNAAKTANVLGTTGRTVQTAGNVIDPLQAVIAPAKLAAAAAPHVIGAMSHVGDVPYKEALKAGEKGGQAAKDFVENIKGVANTEDAVNEALKAVEVMRNEMQTAYNTGMIPVRNDKAVLHFNDVHKAIADADKVASFHGRPIQHATDAIRQQIKNYVYDWQRLPSGTFHTPAGLDALKKEIGQLYAKAPLHSSEKLVIDKIYGAVKATIQKQSPTYANTMKRFEDANDQIRQIQQELSLPGKKKVNVDTALKKLQSTMRNNVNTSYGRRQQLMQKLVAAGADNIAPKLAGQALQPVVPRGLGRLGMQLAVHGGIGAGVGSVAGIPAAVLVGATLPAMSPRLMGNAFYHSGRLKKTLRPVPARAMARGSYQADQYMDKNPYAP